MNEPLERMTDRELRRYISFHRGDEEVFSRALEVLLSRKEDGFKYPPPQEMSYEQVEAIFRTKLDLSEN